MTQVALLGNSLPILAIPGGRRNRQVDAFRNNNQDSFKTLFIAMWITRGLYKYAKLEYQLHIPRIGVGA
jgi:hypothetical protein